MGSLQPAGLKGLSIRKIGWRLFARKDHLSFPLREQRIQYCGLAAIDRATTGSSGGRFRALGHAAPPKASRSGGLRHACDCLKKRGLSGIVLSDDKIYCLKPVQLQPAKTTEILDC